MNPAKFLTNLKDYLGTKPFLIFWFGLIVASMILSVLAMWFTTAVIKFSVHDFTILAVFLFTFVNAAILSLYLFYWNFYLVSEQIESFGKTQDDFSEMLSHFENELNNFKRSRSRIGESERGSKGGLHK